MPIRPGAERTARRARRKRSADRAHAACRHGSQPRRPGPIGAVPAAPPRTMAVGTRRLRRGGRGPATADEAVDGRCTARCPPTPSQLADERAGCGYRLDARAQPPPWSSRWHSRCRNHHPLEHGSTCGSAVRGAAGAARGSGWAEAGRNRGRPGCTAGRWNRIRSGGRAGGAANGHGIVAHGATDR